MGGGLFGMPLYLNLKCLVFSLSLVAVYWLPHPKTVAHNLVMSFLLSVSAYIAMAWYDVLYDCNDRLKPTLLGWMTKSFKPPEYAAGYEELPLKTQKFIRTVDVIVVSVVVFTFMYPFLFNKKV
jgi:hypothetical protein